MPQIAADHLITAESIDDLFFVLPRGSDNFHLSKKIVLYDTKHGMTKYGFKVGTYSTVDKNKNTQIIAVDAHGVEDEENFRWGSMCSRKTWMRVPLSFLRILTLQ